MDIHDMSDIPESFALLQKHKGIIDKNQELKGQRATPKSSRSETVTQFMATRNSHLVNDVRGVSDSVSVQSSYLPLAYPPSTAPFNELNKMMLEDLSLETHHRGRYLLLRTVTPADIITGVSVIAEDEDTRVALLVLYNQGEELSKLIELGTVLVVKEPYLKVLADEDYCIHVDHISDLIIVPDFDECVPLCWRPQITSADDSSALWKDKGNEFFDASSYWLAIQCYTKALERNPPQDLMAKILLNRALCCLKTHQFDAAILDADSVLQSSELSEKALLRKAQALYYLRRYSESCETHKLLAENYPENSLAQHEFQRASARLAEQETGKYEFKKMILEAQKRHPPHLERGTYVGPVTIKATESHGKGLFTTEAVKAGDLLLCEKAFGHAYHDEKDQGGLTLLMNYDSNRMALGSQVNLIETIVRKLHKSPSLVSEYIDLHHGTYDASNIRVDGNAVVDTFLVQKIIDLNCFGCPLLSRDSHIKVLCDPRIYATENKKFYSTGIWCMASYINHSCLCNIRRSFIGDMMIIRASKDIPPDTEITFWYGSPLANTRGIPANLEKWGFECDCASCQDIRGLSENVASTRQRLYADIEHLLKADEIKLLTIQKTNSKIAKTYSRPQSEVPRLLVWPAYLALTAIWLKYDKFEKAIKFGLKALAALGFVIDGGLISDTQLEVKTWGLMTDGVVGCWMLLSHAYSHVSPRLATQAKEYTKTSYKICVGEDETFDETYGKHSPRSDGLLFKSVPRKSTAR
ncbi:uncharacterized protein N7483_001961 [Penicillium malachiteum]|uniref:uncharacterized protein n=1 Tax=Penicillium malachiteum TaxID=1324776 RepID=UPI002546B047|nr:uncharacterized protein N7483_001961 [Penicillium malachiteum]KAJ5736836.1 hypothetical protein N7483_001961 [Penicillium malachiteum]